MEYIGRPVEHVLVAVDCPESAAIANMSVEVAGDHLYVNMPGHKQLDIHLHFAVSTQHATSELSAGNKQLQIKLPYMSCQTYLDQVSMSSRS